MKNRYIKLSHYLKDTYKREVKKVCIDGGFSCPNRDGTVGTGGCIFCSGGGSGEHMKNRKLSISEQVKKRVDARKAIGKEQAGLILYFQNFTNTYAPIDVLHNRYEDAIYAAEGNAVCLAIGTRPDCIDQDVVETLINLKHEYKIDIWVELGLQTSNDETAKLINRGYKSEQFTNAVWLLQAHGIKVVAHIILGLPGEIIKDIKRTVRFVNKHKVWGIKLHALYILKESKLAKMYLAKEFSPISMETYIDWAKVVLSKIRKGTVVHRFTSEADENEILAPMWVLNKEEITQKITGISGGVK